ncbi:MAG: hypothetical protein PsegKO_23240 [Pseudohongiellaceae bacterium]|jgi:hypothetical protein
MQLPTRTLLPNGITWRQPSSLLVAGLLLAAFLALNVSSSGTTGGDDTGSGIGGTGRMAEPGSGLGGTGLKPFLGFDANTATGPEQQSRDIAILPPGTDRKLALTETLVLDIPAQRDIERAPLPSPAQVAATKSFTRDSSAISITEQIQREIDSNALYFNRLNAGTSPGSAKTGTQRETPQPDSDKHDPVQQELLTVATETADDDKDLVAAEDNAATPASVDGSPESVSWTSLASYLAEQQPTAGNDTPEDSAQTPRLERPERVVRPELPPIQRVRPVQRAAVLPPRIKPLSL